MSHGGGALADLVTQAPEACEEVEAPRAAALDAQHGQQRPEQELAPPSRLARLCACCLPAGHRHYREALAVRGSPARPAASKLASIVPNEAAATERVATTRPPPPPLARGEGQTTSAAARGPLELPSSSGLPHKVPTPSREHIWGPEKNEAPQLGPQVGQNQGRKTLVLDLDETLVHSSFRSSQAADIVISVELEGEHHKVYVRKRPGVDAFLTRMGELYEVVVYTASMAKYANPLLDELDKSESVHFRLFREACTRQRGGYVKDLSKLGRDLDHVIIIDNSPICYAFQPNNAIPIRMFKDDMSDRELFDLIPILHALTEVDDIPAVLKQIVWSPDEEGK